MEKKLSEIILEMIKPYHKDNHKRIESLVSIAACVWNMTIVPENVGAELYKLFINTFEDDEENKQIMKVLISSLIKTKLEQYPQDKRYIVNYKYDSSSQPPNLQIISTQYNDNSLGDIQQKNRVGRNDPCPCSSGKKYKKCCGR